MIFFRGINPGIVYSKFFTLFPSAGRVQAGSCSEGPWAWALLAAPLLGRCSLWQLAKVCYQTSQQVFQQELESFVPNSTSHVNFICLFWICSSLSSPNPQFLPSGSLPISETRMLSLFRTNFSPGAPFLPSMSHLKTPSMFYFQMFLPAHSPWDI